MFDNSRSSSSCSSCSWMSPSFLASEISHRDWFLAKWARIILFQPVWNTFRVKNVSCITRKFCNFITLGIFNHADCTFWTFGLVTWFELFFGDVSNDFSTGASPISIWSISVTNGSNNNGTHTHYDCANQAAFEHCEVT